MSASDSSFSGNRGESPAARAASAAPKGRDVFVINTPLQLLNANEARHHYDSDWADLVILHWNRWPRPLFERLIQHQGWASVRWVPMEIARPLWGHRFRPYGGRLAEMIWTIRRGRQRRWIDRTFRSYSGRIERLAVGNYCQSYMRHILNTVPHTKSIALDDGTDSLKAAAMRAEFFSGSVDDCPPHAHGKPTPLAQLKGLMATRWVDMADMHPNREIEFFTVYRLEPIARTTFARHDYPRLRSTLSGTTVTPEVLFLGQPLVEDGYLRAHDFEQLLRRVAGCYSSHTLVYCPHPRESHVSADVVRRVGLRTRSFVGPIEAVMASGEYRPMILSSFFCSALVNCRLMFGRTLEIHSVRIPDRMIGVALGDVQRIYEYLASGADAEVTSITLA